MEQSILESLTKMLERASVMERSLPSSSPPPPPCLQYFPNTFTGHGIPELLEAILKFFPLDAYVKEPVSKHVAESRILFHLRLLLQYFVNMTKVYTNSIYYKVNSSELGFPPFTELVAKL